MHLSEVIIKPLLTEKNYKKMAKGVYTFVVNRKANKIHIKKSFEKIFEVKVANVNIINSKPKTKIVGKFIGKTKAVKKAMIKLVSGEKLNLFNSDK